MRAPDSWPGQKSIPSGMVAAVGDGVDGGVAHGVPGSLTWLLGGAVGRDILPMTVERMITVSVRVHPGASREDIVLLPDGSLDVRMRARSIEGQANAGLLALLADR